MDNETDNAVATQEEQGDALDLSGSQDIVMVQSLYQKLTQALESGAPVTLDLSQTDRLDGAAAQLLLAFVQAARNKNQDVQWRAPSDAFRNAVRLLGLSESLGLPDPA